MRIAVNTRLLLAHRLEGIGWFSCEILRRITQNHPEHQFYFFFDRRPDPSFIFGENVKAVVLFPPSRHPFLWYWYFEWSLPRALKKYQIELLISPDGWIPLRAQTAKGKPMPCLNVIHDLNFEHFPDFLKPLMQRYCKYFFPRFAKRADRLVTVSEYSKQDICQLYGIEPNKVSVVYNAAHARYSPISEEEKRKIFSYTAGCPYFIYVGSIHARKNVGRMLQAFDSFKEQTSLPYKFMIVGHKMWKDAAFDALYAKLKYRSDIVWMGRVEPEKLSLLVGGAEAMIYVSLFEGFGIPIVEAFAARIAVLTSTTTSMPEVGGDAAAYADPYSVASIGEQMTRLATDLSYKESLMKKGQERARLFSWDKSAQDFWKVVESLI